MRVDEGREWPFVEPVLVHWRPFTYQEWIGAGIRRC